MTEYLAVCQRSLEWARLRDFKGYSKFDALNSPVLRLLSARSRFLRSAFVFGLSRCPVNLRPLLGVKKGRNPKGLALFARTYLNLFELTGERRFKQQAVELLEMLLRVSQVRRFSGHCWGYDHPWQNIAFFIPAYEPNCVVTCAAGEAFLQAYRLLGDDEFLNIGKRVADFILKDLRQIPVEPGMRCCSYDLHSDWKVVNVNAFASAYLAQIFKLTGDRDCKSASMEMMRWVVSQQTGYHAWYYTDPPDASRITHDNYHTGFVLDSIQEYLEIFPDVQIEQAWRDGLKFYQENLFTTDFAPKWMHDRTFPNDIHGAAQGIITFSRASVKDDKFLDKARGVLDWTLKNLYEPKQSRFFYQKGGYRTKRFTLMRWCQAWMCYAISVYLKAQKNRQ